MKSVEEVQSVQTQKIHFPDGLIGLENYRNFTFEKLPDQDAFFLLQSLEDEHFGLVVTNPFWFMSDYDVELDELQAEQMGDKSQLDIWVTVTVAATPENITANLMGPIVVNLTAGIGLQIVVTDKRYTAQYKLMSATPIGG